jgi:hypothetical protein
MESLKLYQLGREIAGTIPNQVNGVINDTILHQPAAVFPAPFAFVPGDTTLRLFPNANPSTKRYSTLVKLLNRD